MRNLLFSRLIVAVCAMSTLFAVQAFADYPENEVYLGLFGGVHLPERNWDFGDDTQNPQPLPTWSADMGVRLGYQLSKRWAVELGAGYLPITADLGGKSHAFRYDADVLFHLLTSDWTPFIVAGFGAYHSTGGALGKDVDPQVHAGVGVRGLILPWLALRAEAREMWTDGFDAANAWNLGVTAGVDIFFGGKKAESKPAPVVVENDRDHDGVLDVDDKCPDVAGTAERAGCPAPADRDGDGILDADDKCPDVAGKKELNGCPDKDGDGIADGDDKCPDVAGKKELAGCPDSDNDGIADADDKCPTLAGTANRRGCPDRDGDGILDADDKCPDIAGVKEADGCLPKAVQAFAGVIKGINFDTGKASIMKSSHKVLESALPVLKQYASLRLRIEGHTDNVGDSAANKKLSQERADAVRTFFAEHGIEANRFETVGFGDSKPIADNKTKPGRAQNRRIEFAVIGAQ